jgi:hypothetical protein
MRHTISAAALASAGFFGQAQAQTASPQTAPSPWSLEGAVGADERLTLSATARVRIDTIDGQPRPGFNASDTVVNLRSTLFAEYDAGPVRLGAELYDSRANGANARTPITTNEVNVAELVQAYVAVDLDEPFGSGTKATAQAGRFVLNLGSRRVVAADDYRNTTNGYTGLRLDLAQADGWKATAVYVLPTQRLPDDQPALLDNAYAFDREGSDMRLWGLVAAHPIRSLGVTAEVSYFRFDERDTDDRRTRDRALDTFGGRVFRPVRAGAWDFEIEAFRQTGSISGGTSPTAATVDVAAHFVHADVGYSFDGPMSPRVSLRYDWVSGDKPGESYERFDTLYGMRRAEIAPSGLYNAVGRANLSSPAVRIEWLPTARSDAFLAYRPLWLASRTDSFSTSSVVDGSGASGAFAGHQWEGRMRHWLVRDALRLEIGVLHLAKGRFLEMAPNAPATGDTTYSSFNLTAFF